MSDYKTQKKIKDWIKERPSLNITKIEKESFMPSKALAHFLGGRRGIPTRHLDNLIEVLWRYGYES